MIKKLSLNYQLTPPYRQLTPHVACAPASNSVRMSSRSSAAATALPQLAFRAVPSAQGDRNSTISGSVEATTESPS